MKTFRPAAILTAFLAAACSDSLSPTPSLETVTAPTPLAAPPAAVATSIASGEDIGGCLSGGLAAACSSALSVQPRDVSRSAATAPGTPGGFTSTVSGSTVYLSWSAASSGDPVTTYVLEAGSAPGLANLVPGAAVGAATNYTATGVGNGTYYVRVRGRNASGTSAASNEIIVVVGSAACDTAPNAPGDLTITLVGTALTLSWSAPVGGCPPASYQIEAGSTSTSSDIANFDTGNTSTMFFADLGSASTAAEMRAASSETSRSALSGPVYVRIKGNSKTKQRGPANATKSFSTSPTGTGAAGCTTDAIIAADRLCTQAYPDANPPLGVKNCNSRCKTTAIFNWRDATKCATPFVPSCP
jgi:hypothetical protein